MRRALLAVAALTPLAAAQPSQPVPVPLGDFVINHAYLEQAVANALAQFRELSPDGQSVSPQDLADRQAKREAQTRGAQIGQMLQNDLDADGVVTRQEVERGAMQIPRGRRSPPQPAEHQRRNMDKLMAADGNGDDRIDFAEMLAAAAAEARQRVGQRNDDIIAILIGLEPSGDKILARAEAEQLVRAAFSAIDTNSDGEIAYDERESYHKLTKEEREAVQREQRAAALMRACSWPGLPRGAAVTSLTVTMGGTISSVALAGQDQLTTVVYVDVQSGEAPVHVLLGAYRSVVWVFRGDVGRVQGVGLARGDGGESSLSGVVGIDRAKVSMLQPGSCFVGAMGADAAARQAMEAMLKSAGAGSVEFYSDSQIVEARVPAGGLVRKPEHPVPPPKGTDEPLWFRLINQLPGGLAEIDPATVVSSGKAEVYDVRPREAGLIQLISEGVLRTTDERIRIAFEVVSPMRRFPADAEALFLQPSSFPMPAGSSGQSCLMDKDSFAVLAGHERYCESLLQRHQRR